MLCLVQCSRGPTIKTFRIVCLHVSYHKQSPRRNKKDKGGIVIRNKARLVAQGHTQEEGIDYDEVFALVARIEAIRLFLAYALYKDFMVYQIDVKSAFLYGKIEEEVYVCQPSGFEDPDFPDRVYKVEKALYGLHQAPRACISNVKTASTPMETYKPLLKDADGEDIDEHMYRSMIGSLMYLTSSRTDIMFDVCVASDDLRDALSVIFGLSELKCHELRRLVSIRCQGYIGDFVLGSHAKDMVVD
ncbi:retrovirus-related pol polyprotein from transposon TNT 1-94 [Tanacetum coccineum]|uniref:Retrovirus-related pol polyprotein from transposon TNT 1-94 n=1 Tax=Tanacetum coccineum TaxID=301880 RepID=A0ABQ4ZAL5_9ASTR